jgi:glycosyltransferase involved in cell wall biosynthesis
VRPIRVIQLVAGVAIGDQSGGAEQFGLQLARHLNRQDFEVRLFAMWGYGSAAEAHWLDSLAADCVPVAGLVPRRGSSISELPVIARRFLNFVSDFRPDIVNSHSQRGDPLNLMSRWFHAPHPKAVRTIHVSWPWLNRAYLDVVFNNWMFPGLFDAEVAISELVRLKLDRRPTARLLRRKAELCYNGVEPRFFQGRAHLPEGASSGFGDALGRPCIGMVGRLTREKGHADMLDAMRLICARRPVHLAIVGSGPLESRLQEYAAQIGVAAFVHFLGSRNDVADLLPQFDLLVSPSLSEGFPTVLLEAMAAGVPVIATDVPGSREVVQSGQTGTLVPPRQPALFAEAVLAALADLPALANSAIRAKEFALQFTIENAARRYEEIYHRLAGR